MQKFFYTISILLLSNCLSFGIAVYRDPSCGTTQDPCDKVNSLLAPCGITVPSPPAAAYLTKCACNKVFYDLLVKCTTCMSTDTTTVYTKNQQQYEADCNSFGAEFMESG
ncbi:18094_t:CDS:2 [Acaulospora morrowiae]|uniref:18094_t:CDS:1 n=1 Tax=Acaulospora morrowiae TaxID=94023 RepID=A0A9N9E1J4_9GLOM|nr:18094_t:CDS:2 [Acaulospora morrowiae]